MRFLRSRCHLIATCVAERLRHGAPEIAGPVDREVVFILDGVGGFQAAPLMVALVVMVVLVLMEVLLMVRL